MRALPAESLLCHQHDYGRPDAPMQCSIDYASDGWVIPSQPSELYSKDGPTIEFDVSASVLLSTLVGLCDCCRL